MSGVRVGISDVLVFSTCHHRQEVQVLLGEGPKDGLKHLTHQTTPGFHDTSHELSVVEGFQSFHPSF